MEGVINCVAYRKGFRIANIEIEDINKTLRQRDKFVWVGLNEPETDLLKKIQTEFDLHDLAIEDAHNAHQRPKLETYAILSFWYYVQHKLIRKLTT